MKILDSKKRNIILCVILVALTVFRLLIHLKMPLAIFPEEGFDDRLCYEHGFALARLDYLGEYNYLVLSKYYMYGLFMAICYFLMIPYSLGLGLLNVGSAYALKRALGAKLGKVECAVIYLLCIYNPVYFTSNITQRVYRNAILPSAVVLVMATFFGIYFNAGVNKKKMILWSILGALALPFMWYIKEDSIWIAPFMLVTYVLTTVKLILATKSKVGVTAGCDDAAKAEEGAPAGCDDAAKNEDGVQAKAKSGICIKKAAGPVAISLIPVYSLIAVTLLISVLNYTHYGVFMTNDRKQGEFAKLIGNLMSIESDDKNEVIWVSNSMIKEAEKYSPTLASIDEILVGENDEPGDHIEWHLKFAMVNSGVHYSATDAEEFCGKVNDELEVAFREGKLKRDSLIHITKGMRGMTMVEIFGEIPDAFVFVWNGFRYTNTGYADFYNSYGNYDDVRRVEAFLGSIASYYYDDFSIKYGVYPIKIGNILVKTYQALSWITAIASIGIFLGMTIDKIRCLIKKIKADNDLYIMALGSILTALVVAYEFAVFSSFYTQEMISNYRAFYLCGEYMLVFMFKMMCLGWGYNRLVKFIKNKKETK